MTRFAIIATLVCDACGAAAPDFWLDESPTLYRARRLAQLAAQALKWDRITNRTDNTTRDFCPACARRERKRKRKTTP